MPGAFLKLAATASLGPFEYVIDYLDSVLLICESTKSASSAVTRVTTKGRRGQFRQIEGQFGGWWGHVRMVFVGPSLRL